MTHFGESFFARPLKLLFREKDHHQKKKNVFSFDSPSLTEGDSRTFNEEEEKNLTQKVYDVLLDVLQHEQLRVFEQEKRWR